MEKSGIYLIKSKSKNRIYIGSSVDIKRRWRIHKHELLNNKHHSCKLQNHVNKYSIKDIEFCVLEFCNKEILLNREQFYLDNLKPYFNIRKQAESNLGIKRSELTKNKLSEINTGKKLSEETKRKMSDNKKGYFNSEDKLHIKKTRLICTETAMIFESIKSASEYIGMKRTTLNAKIKGQNKNNTTLIIF